MRYFIGLDVHSNNTVIAVLDDKAKRFYQRKSAKTNKIVATKALAHKLARASYFIMQDRVDYEPERLFG